MTEYEHLEQAIPAPGQRSSTAMLPSGPCLTSRARCPSMRYTMPSGTSLGVSEGRVRRIPFSARIWTDWNKLSIARQVNDLSN